MSPEKKRVLIQEIPTWTYRAVIGGMLTLMLMWFQDFRHDYSELKIDHQTLKKDFLVHKEVQKGQINLITRNIQILYHNQNLFLDDQKNE